MKTVIIFWLFVLSCHEVVSTSPALIIGNCTSKDIPADVKAGCNKVTCHKHADGNKFMKAIACAVSQCPRGKKTKLEPPNLTKVYPDCCPNIKCE